MEQNIKDKIGDVVVADEVLLTIAGLAATEVKGVYSLGRTIIHDAIPKTGLKSLSKCVKIVPEKEPNSVSIKLAISVDGTVPLPKISDAVKEHVTSAIEAMTGMIVASVNIQIVEVLA